MYDLKNIDEMHLKAPNFEPAFNIIRLSHIEMTVKDLAASKKFYVDTLGFILTEETSDTLYLRCLEERNHHSYVLVQSNDTPVVKRMAYKVASEAELDKAEAFFKAKGLPTSWVEKHAQGRTLHTTDTSGMPLEFYFKMEHVQHKLQEYAAYQGMHPMRIDHFNCFTPNVEQAYDFYSQELGFRATEYTYDEAQNDAIWAVWMHRKGGVHDLAFTNGKGPRLHHVCVWVPTALNIIHLCDVMATSGYVSNIERGPGRHGISNAFFLYILDPDGHRTEIYTSDYMTVDPDHQALAWELRDSQRQTLWGHAAPRSWFEHGSRFEGLDVSDPLLEMKPIIAN